MKRFAYAAIAGVMAMGGANAADLYGAGGGYKDAPVVVESWTNPGDIFVRARGLAVIPNEKTKDWTVNGSSSGTAGFGATISTSGIPELDVTYFLTKNIAVEAIAGVTPHTVDSNSVIGAGKIADVWLLPPTVTLQYHLDTGTAFKPYIGAGVNYTVFFGVDEGSAFKKVKFDNNWGFALQAGFDYKLAGNWFLNFDFKYLFLDTDVTATLQNNAVVRTKADIDPIIVGAGIGYKFGSSYVPLK
ncbi:OmpW family protein [Rhodomicrobium vannielii ATCC 17100]|uniref:OmpW family protein n=1 Tax=Rhodomicrobium vannielii (strain ATCC 17100 / DSM 162 / LMG 4299 / NCIMB 10020 / ATH 3.1.1) TaxID=648757 RepID=E3HZ95_RHOVT|nr:OmpW family outer membrane protein [Rhodomicrobium vannielii]ADP69841.1 OmpW family protein [Rhodomicrobium vannielii ATCC 17100]